MVHKTAIMLFLPDGKVALQRRTADAPVDPGKIGLFGGALEAGETPEQGARRELGEETSLDLARLALEDMGTIDIVPGPGEAGQSRRMFVFRASIPSADFQCYEGTGVEAYTIDELRTRDDQSALVTRILQQFYGGN